MDSECRRHNLRQHYLKHFVVSVSQYKLHSFEVSLLLLLDLYYYYQKGLSLSYLPLELTQSVVCYHSYLFLSHNQLFKDLCGRKILALQFISVRFSDAVGDILVGQLSPGHSLGHVLYALFLATSQHGYELVEHGQYLPLTLWREV